MVFKAIVIAVLGGLLCLDRIVLQGMVSRPVVTGPIVGFCLGDAYTGLIVGAFMELFWINRSPIGAYVPPNDTLATVVITAAAILAGQSIGATSRELIALTFLVCLPAGLLGQKLDVWKTARNELRARLALNEAQTGDAEAVSRRHHQSLLQAYLGDVILIGVVLLPATLFLGWIYPFFPLPFMKTLLVVYFLLPVLGVGVALNTIHVRGVIPVFCGLFLTMNVVLELFRFV